MCCASGMSGAALALAPSEGPFRSPETLRGVAESASIAIPGILWVFVLTRSSGGLHDIRTAILAVSMLPAAFLTQPWMHASRRAVALVLLLSLGTVVVFASTPTGWSQADSPAALVLGFVAFILVSAFARTPGRRRSVAVF